MTVCIPIRNARGCREQQRRRPMVLLILLVEVSINVHQKSFANIIAARWCRSFTEIGGGQGGARWFFKVGGAAGMGRSLQPLAVCAACLSVAGCVGAPSYMMMPPLMPIPSANVDRADSAVPSR